MTSRQHTRLAASKPRSAPALGLIAFAMLPLGAGCASQLSQQPRIGQAGPGGVPSTTSPYAAMALGTRTATTGASTAEDLDGFLLPEASQHASRRRQPARRPATPASQVTRTPRADRDAGHQRPEPVEMVALSHTRAPLAPLSSDAARYSQRESSELMQYRGGDVVVISASTIIIVLLVALLIILLT